MQNTTAPRCTIKRFNTRLHYRKNGKPAGNDHVIHTREDILLQIAQLTAANFGYVSTGRELANGSIVIDLYSERAEHRITGFFNNTRISSIKIIDRTV